MHTYLKPPFPAQLADDTSAAIPTVTRGYVLPATNVQGTVGGKPTSQELPYLVGQFPRPWGLARPQGIVQCDAFPAKAGGFMVLSRAFLDDTLYYWLADFADESFTEAVRLWSQAGQVPVIFGNPLEAGNAFLLPFDLGPGAAGALKMLSGSTPPNPNFLAEAVWFVSNDMAKRISNPAEFGIRKFRRIMSCVVVPEEVAKDGAETTVDGPTPAETQH